MYPSFCSFFKDHYILKKSACVIAFWTLLVIVWKLMIDLLLFKRGLWKRRNIENLIIRNCTERRRSCFFPTKFVVCCKAFGDFQIELFVKEESFSLRRVTCNYAFAAENVEAFHIDFDNDGSFVMHVRCDSDNHSDDSDSNRKQTGCFEPSVSFSKMRNNLSFSKLYLKCKQTFLRYFTQKLHVIEKNTFFSLK